MIEDMSVYDDVGEKLLKKNGAYHLFELPYFGNYEPLCWWLMRRAHEDFFYFSGWRERIRTSLISTVIGIRASGLDLDIDLTDKAIILEMRKELGYTNGLHGMDIDKLKKYLVVQATAHLVTKLNDQGRWSQ
ncbi:hypothetical protein KI387_016652, partial [Taxus chinensis]